jgi:formylglycine-generating enzyme
MNPVVSEIDAQMAEIPAGSIALRDDRTGRKWSVTIEPFAICRYPVTQLLYSRLSHRQPPLEASREKPVDSVSWLNAVRFCNQLSRLAGLPEMYTLAPNGLDATQRLDGSGYRLPTEAEWEYACRAGSEGVRYGDLKDIAWYRENSNGGTMPVGRKQPNDWKLYDMLGNVWEWCWDVYDPAVYGEYRVLRGGGWFDEHWSCRASVRRRSHPTLRLDDVGFRVARSVLPAVGDIARMLGAGSGE